jgi:hypothetical protein
MAKREYTVKTMFMYPGKFFVYAKDKDEARSFVKNMKCWKYMSRACTTLPDGKINGEFAVVGWGFSASTSDYEDIIVDVVLSDKVLSAMKNSPNSAKQCYEVVMLYKRAGYFKIVAKNEDEAREIVEKYCKQRNPIYRSTLPPDEVAWEFPRKDIQKIIGEITQVENCSD